MTFPTIAPTIARGLVVAGAVAGCAESTAVSGGQHCQFERKPGLCQVETLVDPRDAESPDEAATLIVKWSWLGPKVAGEVPQKVTEFHMTANDARWRSNALDELGKSRCVIEEAFAPADCAGERHIIFVEADP